MTGRKRTKKFERLVVNAIKRLQDLQGSSAKEISDYLSQEYSVPNNTIQKQVRLALRRGVSYGILQQKSRNTYACNRAFLEQRAHKARAGEVVEPCPWLKHRFGKGKKSKNRRGKKSSSRRKRSKRRGKRKKKKSRSRSGGRVRRGRRKGGKSHAHKRAGKRSDNCLTLLGISSGKHSRKKPIKARRKRHSKTPKKKSRSC